MTGDLEGARLIAVLDTNALIRVALAKTRLARALRVAWEEPVFLLLTSEAILDELGRVLRYPRIAGRYGLTEAAIQEFENSVRGASVVVPGLYAVRKIEADPSDDKFLACALDQFSERLGL
ncbi:MAG: putative toxin-antitoxin system toxin component, PIN family [Chloroflexi bacterium HGW-Chloroflexi-1]|nr:MAG: putative toxin-antitoxin system toxin component, PIN family [Chloroflexi bacterium HGW-Chloroflexi-1]